MNLLRAIDEAGSISAAAEIMQVSYHRAWEKLHEMETRLGVTLVQTQTGGEHGGGARLTDAGRDYVARFERFSNGIDEFVSQRFAEAFTTVSNFPHLDTDYTDARGSELKNQ